MTILDRYVLRQHLGPFLFSFFLITLIFVLNLAFRELGHILSKGLPARVIAEFFFLNLAWIVALAVPMSVLTATLMAFGRLSADNEITALKAGGVSPYRLLGPVVLASMLLAAGLVWFNNSVLPDFNHRAKLLSYDITRKKPTISLEPGVVYDGLPNYNLLVKKVHDRGKVSYVKNILLDDHSDPNVIKTIFADSAVIRLDESRERLQILLFDGEIQELDLERLDEFRRLRFPKHLVSVPVSGMVLRRTEEGYRGDREMSSKMMREKIAELERRKEEGRLRVAKMVAKALARVSRQDSLSATADERQTATTRSPRASATAWQGGNGETRSPGTSRAGSETEGGATQALQRALDEHRRLLSEVRAQVASLEGLQKSINAYWVEIHKKYSIAFASVVFVLIGAPLGVRARRASVGISAGISLLFFLLYWVCLIGGEELADRRIVSPFLAMWLPNFLVGLGGIVLMLRMANEAVSLPWPKLKRFRPQRGPTEEEQL